MKDLLEPLTALVVEAGEAINAVRCGTLCIDEKSDGSPVTQADLAADRILIDGLARLCPDIPTLSEERTGAVTLPLDDSFFLVDPLDGTKEFVAGRDEFTVNLALVEFNELQRWQAIRSTLCQLAAGRELRHRVMLRYDDLRPDRPGHN